MLLPQRIKRPFLLICLVLISANMLMMLTAAKYITLPLCACSAICALQAYKGSVFAKHFLIVCAALVISALSFLYSIGIPTALENFSCKNAEVSGTVCETKPKTEHTFPYVLTDFTINGKPFDGYLLLYSNEYSPAEVGDKLKFTVSEVFFNNTEGIFRFHSLSERTFLTAFCSTAPEITQEADPSDIFSATLRLKDRITKKFFSNMTTDGASVATALITGNKDYLSDEIALSFKISGISHIFAVSGMHLSVWTGIFFIIFKRRAKSAVIPNVAAILFVIFYCIFTGFSPSVLRSGIMLLSVFTAKLIRRHADNLNSLGMAGTVILTLNPFLAGNVSFLLSFTATFSMIWFSEYIIPQLSVRKRKKFSPINLLKKLLDNILISLAVILTTLPVTAVFFGYVSLLSPISSLIVTPLAEAVMIFSFLATVIPADNTLSYLLFSASEFFTAAITGSTGYLQQFASAVIEAEPKIIVPWFILSVAAVIITVCLSSSRKNMLICVLSCTLVLTAVTAVNSHIHKDETKLYIPGKNNSTSIALITASGNAMIYGTGGDFSSSTKVISYLNSCATLKAHIIFVPRSKETESKNTDYYVKKVYPEKLINAYNDGKYCVSELQLSENTALHCESSDDFCVSVINVDGIKIVISSLPCSDISQADEIFSSGDILICRSALPRNVNPENFGEIIIMTDTSRYKEYRAVSTNAGDIEITIKGDTYAISR